MYLKTVSTVGDKKSMEGRYNFYDFSQLKDYPEIFSTATENVVDNFKIRILMVE